MVTKQEILQDLVETVKAKPNGHNRDLDELSLGTAVKGLVAGGLALQALKLFKSKAPSALSTPSAAIKYAKNLVKAKDRKEMVSAVIGLLNICARVLLTTPELRELGHRITQVVQSTKLEDYFDEE